MSFFLKKPNAEKGSLEYITISNPKKVLEGKFAGQYFCEIYQSDKKLKMPACSPLSPVDALLIALEGAKIHLQCSLNEGYTISEPETYEL